MVLKALGTENGWLFHQLHPLNNWLARMLIFYPTFGVLPKTLLAYNSPIIEGSFFYGCYALILFLGGSCSIPENHGSVGDVGLVRGIN